MPIISTKYQFNAFNINQYTPNNAGVYGLYDPYPTVIYYGKSETSIKDRLLSHLSGTESRCTQSATYFNVERNYNPITRERELLEEHKRLHGRSPKCNDIA